MSFPLSRLLQCDPHEGPRALLSAPNLPAHFRASPTPVSKNPTWAAHTLQMSTDCPVLCSWAELSLDSTLRYVLISAVKTSVWS